DPLTGYAGSKSGSMTRAGETIAVDVHLAPYATLKGIVYRADHQTTVAGANVYANGQLAVTNEGGQYAFDLVPLGHVDVRVDDPGARGKGVGSITLAAAGQSE